MKLPDMIRYHLERIHMQDKADELFTIRVMLPDYDNPLSIVCPGWQTDRETLDQLQNEGWLPQGYDYRFMNWPGTSGPPLRRDPACVCELGDSIVYVQKLPHDPRRFFQELYGCPTVKELDKTTMIRFVDILDYE